jgi:hypothetical protein
LVQPRPLPAKGSPTLTALDYSLDNGTTWTAANATISGGAFSLPLTINTDNAPQVVKASDHTNTAVVATSNAFAVNAAVAEQRGQWSRRQVRE